MNNKNRALIGSALILTMVACDFDDIEEKVQSIVNPVQSTGAFVGSEVEGIEYRTETQSGKTNSLGEFDYFTGETITFFIGNLEFPPAVASEVITAFTLAATENVTDVEVVNILRLLQTLDKDGDPSNGIEITEEAIAFGESVDFSLSLDDFAAQPAVVAIISNGGQITPVSSLVSAEAAIDNFSSVIDDLGLQIGIVGEWSPLDNISSTVPTDLLGLVFMTDGTYVQFAADSVNNSNEITGMEWGEYTRDAFGRVRAVQTLDKNGNTGLTDFGYGVGESTLISKVENGILSVVVDEDNDGLPEIELSLNRIPSIGINGVWQAQDIDDDELLLMVFYQNGTYVYLRFIPSLSLDEAGMEWGTYEIDPNTNRITATLIYDGNGDVGLNEFIDDPGQGLYMNVNGDVLEIGFDFDGDGIVESSRELLRL